MLTQNVDGLHRRAGSRRLIEINGNLYSLRCTRCHRAQDVDNYKKLSLPPLCPECGAMVRPKVVLFEELLPTEAAQTMQTQLSRGFDLVFSVGTSALFPYIFEPILRASGEGKLTVEINPDETALSRSVRHHLPLGAVEALEAICARL